MYTLQQPSAEIPKTGTFQAEQAGSVHFLVGKRLFSPFFWGTSCTICGGFKPPTLNPELFGWRTKSATNAEASGTTCFGGFPV